jgi:hypothetical protein
MCINGINCTVERVISERNSKTILLDCGISEIFKPIVNSSVTVNEGDDVAVEFDGSDIVAI